MQGDVIRQVLLPAGLMFIMFSLGIGLLLADFRRVFVAPRAFLVGVACHFFLLPLVAFLVVAAWGVTGALALRARYPAFAARWQPGLGTAAAVIFLAIVVASVARHWDLFVTHTGALAPLVFSINFAMLVIGYTLSRAVGVGRPQAATVAIESSVQNTALATSSRPRCCATTSWCFPPRFTAR